MFFLFYIVATNRSTLSPYIQLFAILLFFIVHIIKRYVNKIFLNGLFISTYILFFYYQSKVYLQC